MEVEYTGRQTDVPAKVRKLAERKLKKLEKFVGRPLRAHVILTVDRHRQIAEVSVHSPRLELTATEETDDMEASVATAMDKLIRQAERHVGKRQSHKKKDGSLGLGEREA
jgi:ribosome hibernation promoting factor